MDIIAKKLNFVQEVLRISDEELLDKLEKFLHSERKKIIGEKVKPLTIVEFNEMIDNAEKDIENGRLTDAKDLLNKINQWE